MIFLFLTAVLATGMHQLFEQIMVFNYYYQHRLYITTVTITTEQFFLSATKGEKWEKEEIIHGRLFQEKKKKEEGKE